jgi:hypothetical protein
LTTVAVDHCPDAHAVVLAHTSGWSVAYSGDGRPSSGFAAAAAGCTLLIQEATFGNDLAGHATSKRHCTTAEALGVAAKAGGRHTVLTHFSQRYPKVPAVDVVGVIVGGGGGGVVGGGGGVVGGGAAGAGSDVKNGSCLSGKREEEEQGSRSKSKTSSSTPRVGVAFDLLQVDVVDAGRLLPALTGPLRKLFDALEGVSAVAGGGGGDDDE